MGKGHKVILKQEESLFSSIYVYILYNIADSLVFTELTNILLDNNSSIEGEFGISYSLHNISRI